ncbi:MAG TPA: histidinol dehydrogenase [Candidatus Tectomicrobia bacterium]|nr:histidinol dehydrogenase [Candidatus Tectomicrobia bacterium]
MLRVLTTTQPDFSTAFQRLLNRGEGPEASVESQVRSILTLVQREGDQAIVDLTARFDGLTLTPDTIPVSPCEIVAAYHQCSADTLAALRGAAENIRCFHRHQQHDSWMLNLDDGSRLGLRITPLRRVGMYVPGGKAVYPSTVLMCGIPAQVAGVPELIVCTPAKEGYIDPLILVAADLVGAQAIYKVGGAQAIAAMAFGTATIPKVDKIVGPGNRYVATAKRLVFGEVGIDLLAGPTELVVVADDSAHPEFLAADLLSEAEHTGFESVVCVTPSSMQVEAIQQALSGQLATLPRREEAARSLQGCSALIHTRDLQEAIALANAIGPEHLELMVENAEHWLAQITCAGAIFLGHYSPAAIGDYYAGPNHVLPTGGTARFSSPLSVEDFVKKSSVIRYTAGRLRRDAAPASLLARLEGYEGHARAMTIRADPELRA